MKREEIAGFFYEYTYFRTSILFVAHFSITEIDKSCLCKLIVLTCIRICLNSVHQVNLLVKVCLYINEAAVVEFYVYQTTAASFIIILHKT